MFKICPPVFWATVCNLRFALCYKTVVCRVCPVVSVLSVTLVYYGQTVGWIRMPLGMEVGLGPGQIVLDGRPGSPHGKRHLTQLSCNYCATVYWHKHEATSYCVECQQDSIRLEALGICAIAVYFLHSTRSSVT